MRETKSKQQQQQQQLKARCKEEEEEGDEKDETVAEILSFFRVFGALTSITPVILDIEQLAE